jgi:hypothetical protein
MGHTDQRMASANPVERNATATCLSVSKGVVVKGLGLTDAESGDAADNGGVLRHEEGVVRSGDGVVGAARAAETLRGHCGGCEESGVGGCDGPRSLETSKLVDLGQALQPKFWVAPKPRDTQMCGASRE